MGVEHRPGARSEGPLSATPRRRGHSEQSRADGRHGGGGGAGRGGRSGVHQPVPRPRLALSGPRADHGPGRRVRARLAEGRAGASRVRLRQPNRSAARGDRPKRGAWRRDRQRAGGRRLRGPARVLLERHRDADGAPGYVAGGAVSGALRGRRRGPRRRIRG